MSLGTNDAHEALKVPPLQGPPLSSSGTLKCTAWDMLSLDSRAEALGDENTNLQLVDEAMAAR
jgi:hypothetical protein